MTNTKQPVVCPYCEKPAQLVSGEVVYPHRRDLYQKKFYICKSCDARVGCHKESGKPLGRLANSELRKAKMSVHKVFDVKWKRQKGVSRSDAYKWLAKSLNISRKECHIGMFDLKRCEEAIAVCNRVDGISVDTSEETHGYTANTPELKVGQ